MIQFYFMRSSRNNHKILVDSIAWLFIVLWVYAAANKLLDYQAFKAKLGQSPLLTPMAGFVAWFIPSTEIIIAISLISMRFKTIGLYASYGLMVLFCGYIIAITQYSDYIPCSCGGILENMTWNQHLVFNVCFVGLSVIGIVTHERNISLQQIRGNRKPVIE